MRALSFVGFFVLSAVCVPAAVHGRRAVRRSLPSQRRAGGAVGHPVER